MSTPEERVLIMTDVQADVQALIALAGTIDPNHPERAALLRYAAALEDGDVALDPAPVQALLPHTQN